MAKKAFFDRVAVERAVDRARVRQLSRFGAFVRRRARGSIRKRKKISEPGKAPSSHTGLLRQFIFFAYDRHAESVVIGPALLRQRSTAPRLLEYGGRAPNLAKYRARPFMRPALAKELEKVPGIFKGSVTR